MTGTHEAMASQKMMNLLVSIAQQEADGHLTIMRFTTNWRVGLGTPLDGNDVKDMAVGETFEEAALAFLKEALCK